MVRPAGLEPATLGLEGRCSIRLSYRRIIKYYRKLYASTDLLSHTTKVIQAIELEPTKKHKFSALQTKLKNLVGVEGFEPPTSCSQSRRATKLRYTPILDLNRLKN